VGKRLKWWIGPCLSLFLTASGGQATASQLTFVGQAIAIVGSLGRGDEAKFARMLARQLPGRIAFVYLASGGGDIEVARDIARSVRAAGLTTVVDASRYPCVGPCVAIFAAGARRVYLHAPASGGNIGARGFRGLGFVAGETSGNGALVALLEELGAPRAARLAEAVPANGVYRFSGADALAAGLATALTPE